MRHVTLRQLQTFAEVLRAGSYAAAAQRLHLTPPAVTVQMRQLEERAGLPLVERNESGLSPTDAGREVAAVALRIETALNECADALAALRGLKGGRVSIGVVSTAKYFAPQLLAAFSRTAPSVEIRLDVGNRAAIVQALENNTLDLALTGRPPEDMPVEKSVIGEHPHIIIARPDHPLAGRRKVPVAALADETFLVREPGSGTRALGERLFADAGVQQRIGMEIGSNETIKQAVMAGLGIAFLSAHTVAAELADGRLVALDIVGLPVVRTWFIVNVARRRLLPAALALRQFLIDRGREFLPSCEFTLPSGPANTPRRRASDRLAVRAQENGRPKSSGRGNRPAQSRARGRTGGRAR
jgi:DNA-binding transcriptional LysR family regulator